MVINRAYSVAPGGNAMQTALHKRTLLTVLAVVACAGHAYAATVFETDANKDGIVNFKDHDQNGGIEKVVDLSNNWLNTYKVIRTAEDLQNIKDDLSAEYVLANDIDLNGFNFEPIGNQLNPFTGVLIGNGYSIRNLNIERRTEDNVGLFRFLDGAKIIDLAMENINMVGKVAVGPIAANVKDAILYKIATSGTVEARGQSGGGLVGKISKGLIEDSYSNCNLKGNQYLGGIIGSGQGSDPTSIVIAKCYSTGNIIANLISSGGIVGLASRLTITDSYSTGTVGGVWSLGGLVGENQGNTQVFNSYFTDTAHDNGIGTPEPLGADAFKGLDHSHPVYGTTEISIWDFENVWEAHVDALPTLRRNPQPTPPQP